MTGWKKKGNCAPELHVRSTPFQDREDEAFCVGGNFIFTIPVQEARRRMKHGENVETVRPNRVCATFPPATSLATMIACHHGRGGRKLYSQHFDHTGRVWF